MSGRKIVVALGGNALGNTPIEQLELVRKTAKPIVDLIQKGNKVIIAHGNGPQVGMINLAMEVAANTSANTPEMPFPECGAMSQGYIGYHLQNALREELLERGMNIPVATVITQVIVNKNDPAFSKPSKPIGKFYSEKEAIKLHKEKGYIMVEDAGRGFRRVVPSPMPIDVAEKEIIKTLVNNDKDFASEKLAEILDADFLIILTAVEKVAINYGKYNQKELNQLSVNEAEKLSEEGHFAPGSMLPKVQAAVKFARSKYGRKSLITSLEKAALGIEGKTGTLITA